MRTLALTALIVLLLSAGQARADEPAAGKSEAPEAQEQGEEAASERPPYKVIVAARRFLDDEPTTFAQEIIGEEARRLPLIDDDLFRSMHLVPGVQADDFSARFALRGGERDDVSVLLDGVPLFDPFHLQDYGGAISAIDLAVVERYTLLADGFPARYGDRMGGVLDVQTRSGEDGPHFAAGFDLINAHAWAVGPLDDDGDFLVAVRRGYLDLFMEMWAAEVEFRPSYGDALVRLSERLSERDTISLYSFAAEDDNEMLRGGERPDVVSSYRNTQSWLTWRRELEGGGTLATSVIYGAAGRERSEGSLGRDVRSLRHATLKHETSLPLGKTLGDLRFGGRLRWSDGDYDYLSAQVYDIARRQTRDIAVQARLEAMQGSLFVQHDARPWSWLRTTVGGRIDPVQGVDSLNLAPRLAVALLPTKTLSLRAAWGIYTQPITPLTLPVETGQAGLGPAERAEHRVLGLMWRPGPWLHLRVEGYQRRYEDLAGFVPNLGSENRFITNPRGARVLGLEIEARGYPLEGRFGWLISYAFSKAEEWVDDEASAYPRADDRTHAVSAGLDVDLGDRGRLNAALRFHSGTPSTPAVGLDESLGAEPPPLVYGAPHSDRLPPFFSLDARYTYTWRWPTWSLQGYLQVVNASFRDNLHERVYSARQQPDGSWAVVPSDEPLLPLLPTLGLEGRW